MLILTRLFISLLVVNVSNGLAISSFAKSLKRIVNGQTATMFEIPCQAELQIKLDGTWSHWCGGVLVTPNKVLTAAHCMDDSAVSNYRVVVGMLNMYGPSSKYQQTLKVSHIYKHESIQDKYEHSNPHDIAVITLATPATFNRNVQPARLAKNVNQYFLTDCLISGWGYTSGTKPKPNTLQKAITRIVPNFECVNYWPTMSVALNGGMYICVYDDEGSPRTGTCVGDSGGPLLCGPNKDKLVGILSGGDAECDVSAPGLCPKDNCEDLTCSGAKGRFRDVEDCPYCKCLRNCPPFQCTLNCDKGYLSDENGCQLCSCKKRCPSVSCALICPSGMKRTKDGCPYCSCCNDLPCLKTLSCEEFEVDSSGCATCSCKQSRFSDLII